MYLFLGVLLIVLGIFCIIMGVSKRAHDPTTATISGFLLLAIGLIILLAILLEGNKSVLYGAGFLVAAVLCFALDVGRSSRMSKCVQPCEGEFCGVINYETLGLLLNRPTGKTAKYSRFFHVDSAVFRYWVQGEEQKQSALDYRFRLFWQNSRFLHQYKQGQKYTIYIDPSNPTYFVTAQKRFQVGLLSIIGVVLAGLALVFFFLI